MIDEYDKEKRKLRYVSLFSGIEAASVAWETLGWEPVAFSEIDKFPCALLAKRYPNVPNLGDITKVDWREYAGSVDVVVGGSPCQSFSIAGKREGLKGASGLMFEYIRAVRELRPRYFVWENVPGALSSEGGAAFGQLLREMDDIGYGLAWRVLDAQFFGVAQRRRRVFLVGCLGDAERAAAVLLERDGMRWDHPSSRAKRKELTGAAEHGAESGCIAIAGNIIDRKPENGGHHLGIEDDGACYSLTTADRHAVAYAVRMRQGKPGGGHGYRKHTIAFDTTQITSPQNGNRPQVDDPCHPLCAGAHVQAIAFKYHAGAKAGSAAVCDDGTTPTLTADYHQPAVCLSDDTAKAACDEELAGTLKCGGMPPAVAKGMIVRRLMPLECERLQGFPDDWTRIPYRGKPAEECPDTPRYKALGNSMCVNVMKWIGVRIGAVDNGECPDDACKRLRGEIFGY